ncbi:MAG: hypothetical protein H6835_10400 [Planctomycetes bacterium]|nr:hypothetical protein [Planctomycetota bacterium]
MKTIRLIAFLFSLGAAIAQTTGTPGINDLTVNNLGSGSTSCTSLCFPNGNVTLNFDISAPSGFAILIFGFCPCATCSLAGPSNSCLPAIPATACGGSNQSLDIDMTAGCGIAALIPVSVAADGTLSVSVPIPGFSGPPCGNATLSVQGVVIDPCGAGLFSMPGPFVFTQSYTLLF